MTTKSSPLLKLVTLGETKTSCDGGDREIGDVGEGGASLHFPSLEKR